MKLRMFDRRPFEQREFVYTWVEWARALPCTPRAVELWRKRYHDVPAPPTTKGAIHRFAQKYRLCQYRDPPPAPRSEETLALLEQGLTVREIAKRMGVLPRQVYRNLARMRRRKNRE